MQRIWPLALLVLGVALPLRAVETSSGYYPPNATDPGLYYPYTAPASPPGDPYFSLSSTNDPTSGQVANWNTGWGSAPSGTTGWNYVGLIDIGAAASTGYLSGVYLGNGYVLTAAHGGTDLSSFTLDGTTYTPDPSSFKTFTTFNDGTGGQADLLLFHLTTTPLNLPSLNLASAAPAGYNGTSGSGASAVMVGFGFPLTYPGVESYGTGTLFDTETEYSIESFNSIDFDIYDDQSGAPDSATNNNNLYPGDSGGGTFIYNTTTHEWELAGINEFVGTVDGVLPQSGGIPIGSGFVEVADYLDQINSDVPEPSTWALLLVGLAALARLYRQRAR